MKISNKKEFKLGVYVVVICILIIISNLFDKNNNFFKEIKEAKNVEETEEIKQIEETKEILIADDNNYEKYVYLTFDDGPSVNVDKLLDLLDEYNAKATFFMVGMSVENWPHLAKKVFDRGHSVGMHSYSHSDKIYEDIENFKDDLDKCEVVFKNAIGFTPNIYRLPFGSLNRYLSDENLELISNELINRGYNYFDWNVSTGDGSNKTSSDDIYINAIRGMDEQEMPVILMHDTNNNTMNAIEYILQYGYIKKYKYDILTNDTKIGRYEPQNGG